MTKIIDGVRVRTFDEWKEQPGVVEIEEALEDEECDKCEGSGEHHCECGDEHDCGFCHGTGTNGGETLQSIYQEELRSELGKLLMWREGLALPVLRRSNQ